MTLERRIPTRNANHSAESVGLNGRNCRSGVGNLGTVWVLHAAVNLGGIIKTHVESMRVAPRRRGVRLRVGHVFICYTLEHLREIASSIGSRRVINY